ncbi:Oidioi.mRNA.OKI2018_I69.PAR.g13170.t1.cds [Oikopleura dioica]|uniref:Oidioi.mRNA.OKI2018_I69.PAR.g13170.t1.cds n=1 Tax=Oikopleura dioica TaxID=34765 RepID=A0ABN7SAA1_OIKDI|nr:Oidioi.mRNA.OKI2018_I69.PAR.g13170.t1.cds [Oikopleura dioica]
MMNRKKVVRIVKNNGTILLEISKKEKTDKITDLDLHGQRMMKKKVHLRNQKISKVNKIDALENQNQEMKNRGMKTILAPIEIQIVHRDLTTLNKTVIGRKSRKPLLNQFKWIKPEF